MTRRTRWPTPDADAATDITGSLHVAATLHNGGHCADALHHLAVLLADPRLLQQPDTTTAVLEQYLARHAACGRLTNAITHLTQHPHLLRQRPGVNRGRLAGLTISTALEHRGVCGMPSLCRLPPADQPGLPSHAQQRRALNALLGAASTSPRRRHGRHRANRRANTATAESGSPAFTSPPSHASGSTS